MWRKAFRALDTDVRIEADDPGAARWLAHMTSTYEPSEGKDGSISYRVTASPEPTLLRGDELVHSGGSMIDLLPRFEDDLYRQLISRCPEGLILHGAALEIEGEAVVLVGPAGSGKSTLALALVERGASYISDELVVVGDQARVRGVTRPISFREQRPIVVEVTASAALTVPQRASDGQILQCALIKPPQDRLCRRPTPLRLVVALNQDHSLEPRMHRLGSGEALNRLWDVCLRCDDKALSVAISILRRHDLFLMTYNDAQWAGDRIVEL
jgi:energy-coupling factor transporter ATP-binding protein EcfA2